MTKNKTRSEHRSELEHIKRTMIEPDPMNARKRFDEVALIELSKSIESKGIIEPIILRTFGEGKKYRIIAGERRWRAAELIKLDYIKAIVHELTDEEAIDLQIHENLHRAELHPMDEARKYKWLIENVPNLDIPALALRVGKTEAYVHVRMKLSDLIELGQDLCEDNSLPLGHALEIAKYSPSQQEIIIKEILFYGWGDFNEKRKNPPISLSLLREKIRSHVLLDLKTAPFSVKATDLREDHLACVDCPQQTSYSPTLFDPSELGNKAFCLNKVCFTLKTQNHISNIQSKLTAKGIKAKLPLPEGSPTDAAYVAPVITSKYSTGQFEVFPDVLGASSYQEIGKAMYYDATPVSDCDLSETAVFADGSRTGKTVKICRSTSCSIHGIGLSLRVRTSENLPPSVQETKEQDEAKRRTRLFRKEELLDKRVAEAVRRQILAKAGKEFGDQYGAEFDYDLIVPLVVRCWNGQMSIDSKDADIMLAILEGWLENDKFSETLLSGSIKTPNDQLSELLFATPQEIVLSISWLLSNGFHGAIHYDNYVSQARIIEIAEEYNLDYWLHDAEERVNHVSAKQKPIFTSYLELLRSGKPSPLPRSWSTEWNPEKVPNIPVEDFKKTVSVSTEIEEGEPENE